VTVKVVVPEAVNEAGLKVQVMLTPDGGTQEKATVPGKPIVSVAVTCPVAPGFTESELEASATL
jgi:hypothetical protein